MNAPAEPVDAVLEALRASLAATSAVLTRVHPLPRDATLADDRATVVLHVIDHLLERVAAYRELTTRPLNPHDLEPDVDADIPF